MADDANGSRHADPPLRRPRQRRVSSRDRGYEVRFQYVTKSCRPFEMNETLVFVGTEGSIRLLCERVVSSDPERCVVD